METEIKLRKLEMEKKTEVRRHTSKKLKYFEVMVNRRNEIVDLILTIKRES